MRRRAVTAVRAWVERNIDFYAIGLGLAVGLLTIPIGIVAHLAFR